MAAEISLRELVGELEMVSDEIHVYLNKITGDFVTITDEDIRMTEVESDESDFADWQRELLKTVEEVGQSDDFVKLPTKFDIDEYSIMEEFCRSVSDPNIMETLLYKIRGTGAFRRFKDTIIQYGIEDDWYKFKDEAFKEIAIDWLKSNAIPYLDDLKGVKPDP